MGELNSLFETLYLSFCDIAKILFALKMALDILKKGTDQDIEGAVKSLLTGAVGYGALYSVDSVLTMVQQAIGR